MLKKLLALICVMAILLTSFTFVTVSAAEDFAPVGLMLQPDVRNDGSYMTISWRNPKSDTLSCVKLYDITSGTATLLDTITREGAASSFNDATSNQYLVSALNGSQNFHNAFVWYRLASLTPDTYKKYRLDFEFSDATNNKSYYLAAAPVAQTTNGAAKTISNKISTYDELVSVDTTNFPYLPMGIETITEQDGNVALKVRYNVTGWYSNSTYGQLLYNFTPTVGKTYKVGFDYKGTPSDNNRVGVYVRDTSTDTQIDNNDKDGIVIQGVSDWTTHTYEGIFTPTTTNVKFKFKFLNPVEEILLDNFYVKECDAEGNVLEGATNLVSNGDLSNLTATLSAAKNLSGEAGNGNATIEWENDDSARFYKIYKDGVFYGIAYPESDGTTSVEFDNLTNDKTYTFGVSAYNQAFAEGEIQTVDVTPEEPAPQNPMISNLSVNTYTFGGTGGALTVSFKNPNVEDITAIELYDVNGDSEVKISDTAFSLEAGALNVYTIKSLTNSTLYNYKLRVTTTSDGLKEYDIAAKPAAGAYSLIFNTDKTDHYWEKIFGRATDNPYPPVDFRVVQNPLATETDYVLNVVSNIKAYFPGNYANLTYNFTDQMTAGTTYRLKFDYMTLAGGSRPIVYINNSELGKIDLASDGWKKASFDFTDKNAATNVIKFSFNNPLESLYINNVELVPVVNDVEGANILTKGDFDVVAEETNEYSVNDVNAEGFDKGATIDYTVSEVGKFVKIYQVTEFGKNLISVHQPTTKTGTITLNNLKNNQTYNLIMTTQNWKDVESQGKEFTVTPKPEDLIIGEFKLLKDGSGSDVANITSGSYDAAVSIKNNGMGNDFTAQLIVAVYNDKKLVFAKASEETTIAQTDSELDSTPLTVEDISISSVDDGDYTVKIMLWKSLDDMTPLKQFKPYAE